MGYYSKVCVEMSMKAYEEYNAFNEELKKEGKEDEIVVWDESYNFKSYGGAAVRHILYSDWTKWYDDFDDVSAFMGFLKSLEETDDDDLSFYFIRVGEEFGDVTEYASDRGEQNIFPTVDIERPKAKMEEEMPEEEMPTVQPFKWHDLDDAEDELPEIGREYLTSDINGNMHVEVFTDHKSFPLPWTRFWIDVPEPDAVMDYKAEKEGVRNNPLF